jgi:hypothetical protein
MIAILAIGAGAASACGIPLICHPDPVYAPMRIPLQDPRPGPVWTSNGWVYPDMRAYAEAPPIWPPGGPREFGKDLPIEPPLERPLK